MAPEQLLGQRVDRRCDIFSFGVVLCEMLTGTRRSSMKTGSTRCTRSFTRANIADANRPELPSDLQRILGKALAKTPKDRYQTVTELAAELSTQARSRSRQDAARRRPRTKTGAETESVAGRARRSTTKKNSMKLNSKL